MTPEEQRRLREQWYHRFGWSAAGVSFVSSALGYWSVSARLVSLALAAGLFVTAIIVRGGA